MHDADATQGNVGRGVSGRTIREGDSVLVLVGVMNRESASALWYGCGGDGQWR